MGQPLTKPLDHVSPEELADMVASIDYQYAKYKEGIVNLGIDGTHIKNLNMLDANIQKLFSDLNIKSTAHKFRLREELAKLMAGVDILSSKNGVVLPAPKLGAPMRPVSQANANTFRSGGNIRISYKKPPNVFDMFAYAQK